MQIQIFRQTQDGRLWYESTCDSWERAMSFIPNWGIVWVRPSERFVRAIDVVYGKAVR